MATQTAAPRLAPGATALSSTAWDTGSGKRGERTLAQLGLAPHILEALHAEGIFTLSDWCRLPRKRRYGIFGVTTAIAKRIDAAAKEVRP